jgi:hypothetical protein
VGSGSSSPTPNNDCDPCPDPCEKEELIQITFKKFKGCLFAPDGTPDRFTFEKISLPKSIALSTKILLDNQAELRAAECAPCCYWDIKENAKTTIFDGIPNPAGQQWVIAKGIARVSVKYNAMEVLKDNTLRSMKRITNDGSPDKSFVNAAVIYIVDSRGHAISQTHLWAVSTTIEIPPLYRDKAMTVRLMPKTVGVNFVIEDTGDRWVQNVK